MVPSPACRWFCRTVLSFSSPFSLLRPSLASQHHCRLLSTSQKNKPTEETDKESEAVRISTREELEEKILQTVAKIPDLTRDTSFADAGLQLKAQVIDACIKSLERDVPSIALGKINSVDELIAWFWRDMNRPPEVRGPIDLDLPENVLLDDSHHVHMTPTKLSEDV
eukprot:g31218.t1